MELTWLNAQQPSNGPCSETVLLMKASVSSTPWYVICPDCGSCMWRTILGRSQTQGVHDILQPKLPERSTVNRNVD